MLVDLAEYRPKNESFEHFFLKQVGRAFLFNQGVRCIAAEVTGITGHDHPDFGTEKYIIDVLGIDMRRKGDDKALKLYKKIESAAIEIGRQYDIVNENSCWKSERNYKTNDEKVQCNTLRDHCMTEACKALGYHEDLYKHLHYVYSEIYQMRGIEVKVSYGDFKNGFSMTPEYSYILAPKGIIPVDQLPDKVGLLEFNFESYNDHGNWQKSLIVTKKPKKKYDSRFYDFVDSKKGKFNFLSHQQFCRKHLFTVAQQNTEESIFWNPHIVAVNEGYRGSEWNGTGFKFNIGDKTPFGLVCDRRWGKNKDADNYGMRKDMDHYRMVKEGEGMTKWIPRTEIEKLMTSKSGILQDSF